MNIRDFITKFPDDQSYEEYLKTYQEKKGVYCKTCSSYNLSSILKSGQLVWHNRLIFD
ncbi:hypothetical protein J2X69_005117 [Algoriphagus sp. 4150]|nr:hypothetical protein [Algoriphagus sp. 4150]